MSKSSKKGKSHAEGGQIGPPSKEAPPPKPPHVLAEGSARAERKQTSSEVFPKPAGLSTQSAQPPPPRPQQPSGKAGVSAAGSARAERKQTSSQGPKKPEMSGTQSEKVCGKGEDVRPSQGPQPVELGQAAPIPEHVEPVSSAGSEQPELKPMSRPKIGNKFQVCTLGKQIKVRTNHFEIKLDKGKGLIFVYDIDITPACNKFKKRQIFNSAWYDPKNLFLVPLPTSRKIPGYGFDGNKNLFTSVRLDDIVEKTVKFAPPGEQNQEFSITINKLTAIRNLADIMNPAVDDATKDAVIAALDIILLTRAKTQHGASLKRSFYYQPDDPYFLCEGTKEIWAGFYASARQGQWSLTLNADVTATVVIAPMTFLSIYDYYQGNIEEMNKYLNGLKKDIKVLIQFGKAPKKLSKQTRTFQKVIKKTGRTHRFEHNGRTVSLLSYFESEYGERLKFPDHPLVQIKSGKQNVYYPMEFCTIAPGQLSLGKLEMFEQSELVKYVTMKPLERYRKTSDDLKAKFLTPEQEDILKDFGITVSPTPMSVDARVLPPVTVQAKPKQGPGAIDIKCDEREAKFFFGANRFYESSKVIDRWAVVTCTSRFGNRDLDQWVPRFRDVLGAKGITCLPPALKRTALSSKEIEKVFADFREKNIQLGVFFVEKGGPLYGPIKQQGDRQYKIATQCVNALNRRKMEHSYLENLVLKVNVKLGGINHVLSSKTFQDQNLKPMFDEDVLLVGADVTHPGREELSKPSIAAVVGSIDRQAVKYVAVITTQARSASEDQVQTQEWISNLAPTMKALLSRYEKNTNRKPNKIIFYRDGVSEGQYTTVLQKELTQIQKACREMWEGYEPAITYIVVRKRIKTKFYAEQNNQIANANVPPGTLVELDITQPLRYFDCFLVPHFSPLGTAKPSHYVVLYDDSRFTPDDLAYLSFCLCHLFPRCTKAVSLPAPVFHAHLAADRANHHLAGKPFKEEIEKLSIAEQRKKHMDHANGATEMDIENSMPNYWL